MVEELVFRGALFRKWRTHMSPGKAMLLTSLLFGVLLLIWVRFVMRSWRTVGAPLPPDSLQARSVASPAGLPEALRVGS
ncbi:MAG: hypothetical protein RL033_2193 [Pseudomonadota bacterium]